ncbi:DUF2147 domain-containing protein [Croceitalea sp. MTPC5]|uniref:DUF2147 domain-containing protein n=1 Tax=Croceitalea sp. MTPC5 TaxID=3056565 RepID=UPI0030D25A50
MNIKLLFGLFIILNYSNTMLFAQSNDAVLGFYWSPKKDGKIEIYKEGNKYHGKFVWTRESKSDINNPNEELRKRDLLGMIFLKDFVFIDGKYKNGKIYDPESGKTYNSIMWIDKSDLKVRGYVGFSFLGRTEIFTKANK